MTKNINLNATLSEAYEQAGYTANFKVCVGHRETHATCSKLFQKRKVHGYILDIQVSPHPKP